MASNFVYSTRDHKFILKEWLDINKVLETERFRNSYSIEDIDPILDNALKVAREVLAVCDNDGELFPAKYENGQVKVVQSYKKAYFALQENGLGCSNKNHQDESALPLTIYACCAEYLMAANLPIIGGLLALSNGAVQLVQSYGSERVKNIFLSKMFSGQWSGTMAITEPNSGSDVGEGITRAYPTEEKGIYRIVGTKCFITGCEQDVTENIVHLTLARIEGAASGTSGLSLFVVPKYWPDEQGEVGRYNNIACAGIEHKMGGKGFPTGTINFGEEGNCYGYLLGEPPGEDGVGHGIIQMFDMMNEERINTAQMSLASATVAYNNAVQYASQRVQGRLLKNLKGGRVPIIQHEDVRRMLMFQKSHLDAFRAFTIYNYYLTDLMENSSDPEVVGYSKNLININTPILKAFCSDMGFQCISEAMQVHGGYGYSEEFPIARLLRDSRILPIVEGTNYIQAVDLVARKWTMAKGKVFTAWLKEIVDFVAQNQGTTGLEREFALMQEACKQFQEIYQTVVGYLMAGKIEMIGFYATRILHASGKLICGKILLDQALVAQNKIEQVEEMHPDYLFYRGKISSARFFVRNIVPEIEIALKVIKEGDTSAIDAMEESLYYA